MASGDTRFFSLSSLCMAILAEFYPWDVLQIFPAAFLGIDLSESRASKGGGQWDTGTRTSLKLSATLRW